LGQEISGVVLSANDSLPVSGATVRILGMDSNLIKGGTSNSNGVFALSTAGSEQMNVVISFIGFETEQISIRGTHKSLNLGKIYLKENAANIGEVVVEAKQRINKVDKSIIIPSASQFKLIIEPAAELEPSGIARRPVGAKYQYQWRSTYIYD
jgi:predicted regulator of Ras-like GTPase activity (Roadblock/LC7/MglB family)